jgi:hypothetical protein
VQLMKTIAGCIAPTVGALLAVAAAGKAAQYETNGLLESFAIALELGMAAWLVSRVRPIWSAAFAAGLFGVFAIASLRLVANQVPNCGCFGVLKADPRQTLALDVTVFAALLLSTRIEAATVLRKPGFAGSITLFACMSVTLWVIAPFARTEGLSTATYIRNGVFALRDWNSELGKSLDLLSYASDEHKLRKGHWKILLLREGCRECKSVRSALNSKKAGLEGVFEPVFRRAVLEVPGRSTTVSRESVPPDILQSELSPALEYYFVTPMVVTIVDGVVVDVQVPSSS